MPRKGGKVHVIRDRHPSNSEQIQMSLCGQGFALALGYRRPDHIRVIDVRPQDMIGMCDTCLTISRKMDKRNDTSS